MSPLPVQTSNTRCPSMALLHFTAICFQTQCCPRLSTLFICNTLHAVFYIRRPCGAQARDLPSQFAIAISFGQDSAITGNT